MSTRPAWSITDCRCRSIACSSSASTSAASADPPAATISLATASTGARRRPVRKTVAPSRAKARGDRAADRASGSVDHRDLVLRASSRVLSVAGARIRSRVGTVDEADTAVAGKLGAGRPPSSRRGRCPYVREPTRRSDVTRRWSDDDRTDQGAGRRRRRVPRADRAVPPRAAGALLPDARILPGRRGRPAGHAAGRLAGPRRVRGTRLDPHLALPDRHQPVPQRAALGQPATRQGVERPRRRAARADPARRGRLARAVSRRRARGCARRAARPGGPLRADRVHLPGLRDRAAGPAAAPARRPHPARRPRIPRERGGRHAGRDRRVGHTAPSSGRAPASSAAARSPPTANDLPSPDPPPRKRSWRGSSARTRPPISTRSWRC